jgi:hypothetical protein
MNGTRRLFPSLLRSTEAFSFPSAATVRGDAISALPCPSAASIFGRPSIFASPPSIPSEAEIMANKRNRKVKKKHRKRQGGKEVSLRRS